MIAFIAAVLWFLVAIGIGHAGAVSLAWLGAAFLALHFAFDIGFPSLPMRRRP